MWPSTQFVTQTSWCRLPCSWSCVGPLVPVVLLNGVSVTWHVCSGTSLLVFIVHVGWKRPDTAWHEHSWRVCQERLTLLTLIALIKVDVTTLADLSQHADDTTEQMNVTCNEQSKWFSPTSCHVQSKAYSCLLHTCRTQQNFQFKFFTVTTGYLKVRCVVKY